ncbi:hypothetical protein [Gelidibacter algens]|jgi:hypothetical protein|uniref:hypothetical protein n=1 Tax=Gelidibacter algens TaxID=49280 RepID=UPI0008051B8F|nr:hypothetical protein [Gelidibacter algens]OBX25572.1 hypothetical protein A9996_09010 [Gelidibacter algens]
MTGSFGQMLHGIDLDEPFRVKGRAIKSTKLRCKIPKTREKRTGEAIFQIDTSPAMAYTRL